MAQRRMFSLKVVDTDTFLDMPISARLLYYDLNMRADDDGFVSSPKKIMKMVGCSDDDLKLLILKQFIIPFETGVCVIRHWRIHNYIQKDRYQQTVYLNEKNNLIVSPSGEYIKFNKNSQESLENKGCIQNVSKMDTQDRLELGQDRLELGNSKESKKESERKDISSKQKYGEYKHVLLTKEELQSLISTYGDNNCLILIKYLDEYIEMKGYKAKSHYLCIKKWVVDACKEKKLLNNPTWLNKNVDSKPATTAEKKEIDDLLSQF